MAKKTNRKNSIKFDSKSRLINIFLKIYPLFLICILGVIIYSNSFNCGFHFDDTSSITENMAIRDIKDIRKIWNFNNTRFVTYFTFALNYHFHHLDVFGYHAVNILIHIITASLVWWLVILILSTPVMKRKNISKQKRFIALGCSLLFLTHPLQTQAVTYIVQRLASLATLFYLATLCLYTKARLQKPPISYLYFLSAVLTALLGMFTKEIVFTLPFVIVLFEFYFFRTREGNVLTYLKNRKIWLYLMFLFFFLLIIPLNFGFKFSSVLKAEISQRYHDPPLTSWIYLITQFGVVVNYFKFLLLPTGQNIDHDVPASRNFLELPTVISFFILIVILLIAVKMFMRYRLASFSIIWFFITLSVESTVKPLRNVMFEHRLYLPLFGFSLLVVSTLYERLWSKNAKAVGIIVMAIIGINSYLTYTRNAVWENEFTLWSDAVIKSPLKARPHNNLGIALIERGETGNALAEFHKALHINPTYAKAYNNIGYLYVNEGNFEKADSLFRKAIYFDPEFASAYNNLGNSLYYQGKIDEAVEQFRHSLNVNIGNPETHNYLGRALFQQGKYDEAVSEYRLALQIDPEYAKAYSNLGILNSERGNRKEAKKLFYKSLTLKPDMAETHLSLGNIYSDEGNLEEAKKHFSHAIQIDPSYMSAYFNLGNSYYKEGSFDKAAEYLGKALALNKNDFDSHFLLGIILRKQEKLHEAVEHFEEALRIQPSHALIKTYLDEAVKASKK